MRNARTVEPGSPGSRRKGLFSQMRFRPLMSGREGDLTQNLFPFISIFLARLYIGPLAENVSPNILEDHFSKFGLVAKSNVVRGVNNDIKKIISPRK